MEPRAGLAVNKNIRLVRRLGAGAMGAVWVADHLTLETEVAVKFISARHAAENPELTKRFMFEAKAAAQMKSPHVVQIFDYGFIQSTTPYIVMELLEGESLAQRLERTGWLSFEDCARVVRHVSRALSRAHALDIVHRDIKPDNIFLCGGEDEVFAKLLDFGVAKDNALEHDGMTSPGVMVGTAEYMSREQIVSSKDVTAHSDLWALAVVAYEMLTGDVPFTGETLGMICVAICNGEFVRPSELRKGVPQQIDAWFERAFATDKEARFATAKDMADAFDDAMAVGGGVAIDDEPSIEPPTFRSRPPSAQDTFAPSVALPLKPRRRFWLAGLALALLSAGGVLVGSLIGGETSMRYPVAATTTALEPAVAAPMIATSEDTDSTEGSEPSDDEGAPAVAAPSTDPAAVAGVAPEHAPTPARSADPRPPSSPTPTTPEKARTDYGF